MPAYYFSIISLGLCAFYVQMALKHYNGKSNFIYNLFDIGAKIGFISYIAFMITATYMHVGLTTIPLFLVTCIIAALTHFIGKMPIVGLISLVGIVVFNIIAWISIL